MADPHQAFRQHVQQKAPDELLGRQRHLSLLAAVGVVPPAKRDLAVLHADEPMVGDGHPVGIARQVVQDMLRPAKRLLHIDHPLVLMERVQESRERARLGQPCQRAVERELLPAEEPFQAIRELSPEHLAEDVFGQKEAAAFGPHPSSAARGKAPGRHNAMNVRMVNQRLSPGVQHAQKADLRTQPLRVGRHFRQGGGHASEQQIVERALVLQHQLGELVRHGEDDVEVLQRNQFAGARRHPAVARLRLALGAVAIAAGVEGEAEVFPAPGAAVAVSAERRRAAALDGPHDLMLRPGDASAATLDVTAGPGAENVGHLQRWRVHEAAGSRPCALRRFSISSGFGASRSLRVARCR